MTESAQFDLMTSSPATAVAGLEMMHICRMSQNANMRVLQSCIVNLQYPIAYKKSREVATERMSYMNGVRKPLAPSESSQPCISELQICLFSHCHRI